MHFSWKSFATKDLLNIYVLGSQTKWFTRLTDALKKGSSITPFLVHGFSGDLFLQYGSDHIINSAILISQQWIQSWFTLTRSRYLGSRKSWTIANTEPCIKPQPDTNFYFEPRYFYPRRLLAHSPSGSSAHSFLFIDPTNRKTPSQTFLTEKQNVKKSHKNIFLNSIPYVAICSKKQYQNNHFLSNTFSISRKDMELLVFSYFL